MRSNQLNIFQLNTKRSGRLFALLVLCLFVFPLSAQWGYRGFVGGMYLHGGYVSGARFSTPVTGDWQVKGFTYGIGGRGAILLTPHYRVGPEGYATTASYDDRGSFHKVGWGGLLNEFYFPLKGFVPFFGVTVGGGRVHHLMMLDDAQGGFEERRSINREYSAFILNPTVGIDIPLNARLNLSLKMDYMVNVTSGNEPDFATGPRLYVGITFVRMKSND